MADDISSLREFNDKLADFSSNVEAIHKHSLSAGLSFKSLITSVFLGENALKAWDAVVTRSTWAKGVDTAMKTLKADSTALLASRAELRSTEAELAEIAAGRMVVEGMTTEMARQRLASTQDQMNVLERQIALDRVTRSTHPMILGFYATVVNSVGHIYHNHQQIGKLLVEANSSLRERLNLTQAILGVQFKLGSEHHTNVEAAKALVDYGYDLEDSFQRNLELVVKMHDGLGVTLRTGAELVAVYENQLGTAADGVANSITRVVNDTALAADEAGRLAVNLGRAVAMLRPGIQKDMSGVMEVVGRYEGALQKLGGQFGSFEKLITKLSTPEGLLQAGILGVNNPEFAATGKGTQQVIDSFVEYAKRTIGNTAGWDRALRLSVVAEQFGMTAQQVNEMILAVEASNQQRHTELTLQERYDEQMRSSALTFQRLRNSLSAMMQEAAIPLLQVVGPIANGIAGIVNTIIKLPGVIHVATGAFLVAAPFMVKRLIDVGLAFYQVAAAAHIAALNMRARALAEASGGIGGVGGAAAAGRSAAIVSRFLPVIAYSLAALGALVAGWNLGNWINRKWGADSVKFSNLALRESVEQTAMRMLRYHSLRNDQGAVMNDIEVLRRWMRSQGYSERDTESRISRAMDKIPEYIGNARFAKESSIHTVGPSNVESEQMKRLADAQVKMIEVADKQREAALKMIEVERQKGRDDSARHAENERARRLNSWWRAPGFILGEAYDWYKDLLTK